MEEIIDTNDLGDENDLIISEATKDQLIKTAKWAKFLAIVGFVSLGLLTIFAFYMMSQGRGFIGQQNMIMGITYLVLVGAYIMPNIYTYQFAVKMLFGIDSTHQITVNEAFVIQRKFYQYMGILMIVILTLYLFSFIAIFT